MITDSISAHSPFLLVEIRLASNTFPPFSSDLSSIDTDSRTPEMIPVCLAASIQDIHFQYRVLLVFFLLTGCTRILLLLKYFT